MITSSRRKLIHGFGDVIQRSTGRDETSNYECLDTLIRRKTREHR